MESRTTSSAKVISCEWAGNTNVPRLDFEFMVTGSSGNEYKKPWALTFYPKSQKFCCTVLSVLGVKIWDNALPDDFDPMQIIGRECTLELVSDSLIPFDNSKITMVLPPKVNAKSMISRVNSLFQTGEDA